MVNIKTSKNDKKENMIFAMEKDMANDVKQVIRNTGINKSELERRALRQYLDGGKDEALLMFAIVQMTQQIHDIQDRMNKDDYEMLQRSIGMIMKIKGEK